MVKPAGACSLAAKFCKEFSVLREADDVETVFVEDHDDPVARYRDTYRKVQLAD